MVSSLRRRGIIVHRNVWGWNFLMRDVRVTFLMGYFLCINFSWAKFWGLIFMGFFSPAKMGSVISDSDADCSIWHTEFYRTALDVLQTFKVSGHRSRSQLENVI